MRWEYRTLAVHPDASGALIERQFNELGQEGFELVAFETNYGLQDSSHLARNRMAIFKRRAQSVALNKGGTELGGMAAAG